MQKTYIPLLCFSLWAVAQAALSESDHHHDHASDLGAHVHGEAELLIAYENNQLNVIFSSPADSLVGFERRAKTPVEKAAVDAARNKLFDAERLFIARKAECDLTHAEVDLSAVEHQDENHHQHNQGHAEISAEYRFNCTGKPISKIRVALLDAFPNIEAIDAQWVTELRQGASELTRGDAVIELTP